MKRRFTTADRARLRKYDLAALRTPAVKRFRHPGWKPWCYRFKLRERRAVMFRWRGFR